MKTAPFTVLKCSIAGVHAVEARSAHSFPRHIHAQFGIGMIREGAQRSFSGRGTVEAGSGMVITVNPGEVHDGMPIGDGGRRWSMLYLDPDVMHGLADGIDAPASDVEFHHPVFDDRRLAGRFDAFYARVTGREADGLAAEEAALLLIHCLVPARRRASAIFPETGRARAMIDDRPASSVSLADLAALCGTSRFGIVRSFTRETGLTPHAYLLQRRVALARRLIAGGTPLAEAAVQSGFFDQSHMTRHFRRILGLTPGALARALR
ncbi:MAG: AraC family transcriptional regulator [Rhizobiaceae bacterium]|nr:AraC family transcriptional regulator [Rhizobiaceae bacterium]